MSSDALTAATSSSSILEIPTPDTVILAPDRIERTLYDFDRVIGPTEVALPLQLSPDACCKASTLVLYSVLHGSQILHVPDNDSLDTWSTSTEGAALPSSLCLRNLS